MIAYNIYAREWKVDIKPYANTFDQLSIVGKFPCHCGGGPSPIVGLIWAEMNCTDGKFYWIRVNTLRRCPMWAANTTQRDAANTTKAINSMTCLLAAYMTVCDETRHQACMFWGRTDATSRTTEWLIQKLWLIHKIFVFFLGFFYGIFLSLYSKYELSNKIVMYLSMIREVMTKIT